MTANDVDTHEPGESFNRQQTRDCSFDVDVMIDVEKRCGEIIVRMELDETEAVSVWEQIHGGGHTYPEDVRERVLKAMQCNLQRAGRGD